MGENMSLLPPPSIDNSFPELKQLHDAEDKSSIIVSTKALRELLSLLLSSWPLDEDWYLATYPDVADAIRNGKFKTAQEHYARYGYLECRLPTKPEVDGNWYTTAYPDVAQGIASGKFQSALDHYVIFGYREGRLPAAGAKAVPSFPITSSPKFPITSSSKRKTMKLF